MIKECAPDLVFSTSRCPTRRAWSSLTGLRAESSFVVFCTTYHEYAVEALRKRAFDYLLKPVDERDLVACAKRITEKLLIARGENTAERPGGRRIELVTRPALFHPPFGNPLRWGFGEIPPSTSNRASASRCRKPRIEQMLQDPVFHRAHNCFWFAWRVQSYNHRNGTLHCKTERSPHRRSQAGRRSPAFGGIDD